jgi:crossover junction endodeoxyribonuclease RusA
MKRKGTGTGQTRENSPSLLVTLPLPPSINAQYATVEGRRTLTETSRKWKRLVEKRLEKLEDDEILTDELKAGFARSYISVFMEFFFPTPHRRDLDGGLKISLDALCEALNINDNRVVEIHLVKRIDPLDPRLQVSMEGIKNWAFDEQYVLLDEKPGDS